MLDIPFNTQSCEKSFRFRSSVKSAKFVLAYIYFTESSSLILLRNSGCKSAVWYNVDTCGYRGEMPGSNIITDDFLSISSAARSRHKSETCENVNQPNRTFQRMRFPDCTVFLNLISKGKLVQISLCLGEQRMNHGLCHDCSAERVVCASFWVTVHNLLIESLPWSLCLNRWSDGNPSYCIIMRDW